LIGDGKNATLLVSDFMRSLTMNVISEVGFGVSLDNSFEPIKEGSDSWALTIVSTNLFFKLLPNFLPLKKLKQFNIAYDQFAKRLKLALEEARKNPQTENKNLISQFATSTIPDNVVIGNMFMFYFAGHETTAAALTFAIRLLSERPEVQEKILQEVKSVAEENRDLAYADYTKLPYTRAVFQESLRFYPPVPVIRKSCLEDLELGGKKIPKLTTVVFNIYAAGRNPKYWNEPEKFIPERFIDQQNVPYSLIAFSAGMRMCIGNKLASIEAVLALADMIRRFRFDLPEQDKGKPLELVAKGVTLPKKPIKIVVSKRI